MNKLLWKLLGVIGIGLSWSMVWGAFFVTLVSIIAIFRPHDGDLAPGIEGWVVVIGAGLLVGFVSGADFGIILSFAENRKAMRKLALTRVAIWGMLAAAAWSLLTYVDDRMMYVLCSLGAAWAVASVAIARRAEWHDAERPQLLSLIGRLVASPLQAACASNGR